MEKGGNFATPGGNVGKVSQAKREIEKRKIQGAGREQKGREPNASRADSNRGEKSLDIRELVATVRRGAGKPKRIDKWRKGKRSGRVKKGKRSREPWWTG